MIMQQTEPKKTLIWTEETDDIRWIVYNTLLDDYNMAGWHHFCSPGEYSEPTDHYEKCADHTFTDIMTCTDGDVEFHAVFTEKNNKPRLIGYICLDRHNTRIFSFGLRPNYRKGAVAAEFAETMRKLAGNGEILVGTYCDPYKRFVEEMGAIRTTTDYMRQEHTYKFR